MESGTSSFTCCGRGCWLSLAAMLVLVSVAAAQQAGDGTQTTAPSAAAASGLPAALPAAVPPGQPLSQAAVSASGVAPSKAVDAAQDSAEQTSEAKLGPGDLIEVNVYNVPELTSKARVSLAGDVYLPLIDYVHVDGLTQEEA